MTHKEILSLCLSNPMAIIDIIESQFDYIRSLETELDGAKEEIRNLKALEIELNDAKDEIRNLKALLNQNSQNSNKPPSTDIFSKKKTRSSCFIWLMF